MTRLRRICAGAAIAVLTASSGAYAAPEPQLTDPQGDHPIAAGDILSATFSTTGAASARVLQIDLVVAAAPSELTPYSYAVTFETLTCNFKAVYYSQPAGPLGFASSGVGCDDGQTSELPTGDVTVSGTTITYRIPLAKSGPALRRGDVLTKIRASTTLSGLAALAEPTPHIQDTASTDRTYRV